VLTHHFGTATENILYLKQLSAIAELTPFGGLGGLFVVNFQHLHPVSAATSANVRIKK
jgi:hypothetical protein